MAFICVLFLPFVHRLNYIFQKLDIYRRFSADMYRGIFKFGVFNAVQSSCFDSVSDMHLLFLPLVINFLDTGLQC